MAIFGVCAHMRRAAVISRLGLRRHLGWKIVPVSNVP